MLCTRGSRLDPGNVATRGVASLQEQNDTLRRKQPRRPPIKESFALYGKFYHSVGFSLCVLQNLPVAVQLGWTRAIAKSESWILRSKFALISPSDGTYLSANI